VRQLTGFPVDALLAGGGALVGRILEEVLGFPGDRLADIADEEGAELIVVGSRGRGALKAASLGSVSTWTLSRLRSQLGNGRSVGDDHDGTGRASRDAARHDRRRPARDRATGPDDEQERTLSRRELHEPAHRVSGLEIAVDLDAAVERLRSQVERPPRLVQRPRRQAPRLRTSRRDGGDGEQRQPSLAQHGQLRGDLDGIRVDGRPFDRAKDDARLTIGLGSRRARSDVPVHDSSVARSCDRRHRADTASREWGRRPRDSRLTGGYLRDTRSMNPDVFITIVFAGIAVLVALVGLVFVVPQMRRDDARARRR
jgi:hypothetical protein